MTRFCFEEFVNGGYCCSPLAPPPFSLGIWRASRMDREISVNRENLSEEAILTFAIRDPRKLRLILQECRPCTLNKPG